MGLSILGIGGSVACCACRQTKHCVFLQVIHLWHPVVLALHMQQVRCSVTLSNSAEHSVQLWRSSAAASMLSACFASALMLRHWRDASEMLLCCGPGLLRKVREVSMSPLLNLCTLRLHPGGPSRTYGTRLFLHWRPILSRLLPRSVPAHPSGVPM